MSLKTIITAAAATLLLTACTTDDAPDVAAPASVPLEFSAVIDGATRSDNTSEKTAFAADDEITITVEGDEDNSYTYQYDGKKWEPTDTDNALVLTDSEMKLTATYRDNNSSSLANNLIANATASREKSTVVFSFTHEACKILINIYYFDGSSPSGSTYSVKVLDGESSSLVSDQGDYDEASIVEYVPATAVKADLTLGGDTEIYFAFPKLEPGQTYVCNACLKFLDKNDVVAGDVYLENGTFARVTDEDVVDEDKYAALKAYAESKGTSVWGMVVHVESYMMDIFISALNDYELDGETEFPASSIPKVSKLMYFLLKSLAESASLQKILTALGGTPLSGYYWDSGGGMDSGGWYTSYYDVANAKEGKIYDASTSDFKAKIREGETVMLPYY